jgi:hypothetical protein
LSDKVEVRRYLEEQGLAHLLVPVCGGPWESMDEVSFDDLEPGFVMKAAHGSNMNEIVVSNDHLDVERLTSIAHRWLNSTYARAAVEPHYRAIPRRVYCEVLIGDPSEIIDYKIHCLNGRPEFILVTSERSTGLKLALFTPDWEELDGLRPEFAHSDRLGPPPHLSTMLAVAKRLSSNIPFVRVDLYDTPSQVYFGEMTFSPAGGLFPYFSKSMQNRFGNRLTLPAESGPPDVA